MSSFEPLGEATREQARDASTVHPVPRWVAPSFVVLGLLTIPWIGYLMITLPRSTTAVHYRGAWVGFDIGLVAALLCTGYQSWRGNARLAAAATAAATMLAVDAWFDVVTTPAGPDLYVSVALAAVVELPLAGVCLWIALHTEHLVERRIVQLDRRATRAEARATRAEARTARDRAARERTLRGLAARARLVARHAHGRPVVGRSAEDTVDGEPAPPADHLGS